MALPVFLACLAVTLGFEGGYSTDPRDPGNWTGGKVGKGILKGTKEGIAASSYPSLDIKNLSDDTIAAIYERDYFLPLQGYQLPAGPNLATFDYGVNSGVNRAAKALQKAAGVKQDGKIGAATLAAVGSKSAAFLVTAVCDARLSFLQGLSTWKTFGKGWGSRVGTVKAKALLMAGATAATLSAEAAKETRAAKADTSRAAATASGGAASVPGAAATGADWQVIAALSVAAVILIICAVVLARRARARREMASAILTVANAGA